LWTACASPRDVRVARSISLHHNLPVIAPWPYFSLLHGTGLRLLSGGQFVLFVNQGKLYCWNVATDRLVWKYHANGRISEHLYTVREFAAQVIDGGRAAIIVVRVALDTILCVRTSSLLQTAMLNEIHSNSFADIIHLDLLNGTSYPVFPRTNYYVGSAGNSVSSIGICGDFVTILVHHYSDKIYLVKLSTQSIRTLMMEVCTISGCTSQCYVSDACFLLVEQQSA
jgi:hypothetical protein